MARIRAIKPEFFQDDYIAELSPLERLAFIGMWTIADDKGLIELRPKRLKVQILPYDECDFEAILDSLASAGFISFLYDDEEVPFIQIEDFEKHQYFQIN